MIIVELALSHHQRLQGALSPCPCLPTSMGRLLHHDDWMVRRQAVYLVLLRQQGRSSTAGSGLKDRVGGQMVTAVNEKVTAVVVADDLAERQLPQATG